MIPDPHHSTSVSIIVKTKLSVQTCPAYMLEYWLCKTRTFRDMDTLRHMIIFPFVCLFVVFSALGWVKIEKLYPEPKVEHGYVKSSLRSKQTLCNPSIPCCVLFYEKGKNTVLKLDWRCWNFPACIDSVDSHVVSIVGLTCRLSMKSVSYSEDTIKVVTICKEFHWQTMIVLFWYHHGEDKRILLQFRWSLNLKRRAPPNWGLEQWAGSQKSVLIFNPQPHTILTQYSNNTPPPFLQIHTMRT